MLSFKALLMAGMLSALMVSSAVSSAGARTILFEFKSRLLHGVAGHAFEKVMLKMTDAFEARAAALSRAHS